MEKRCIVPKWSDFGNIFSTLREIDVSAIRDEAERPLVEKSTAKPAPQVKQTRAPILAPPHIRQNRGVDQRRP